MDFNKSALLGLKAELLRKQQEISGAKAAGHTAVKPKVKLKSVADKVNKGVELREKRDQEEAETPSELLKKSQQMLEKKAKLYEQLSSQADNDGGSTFLVDFRSKETTKPTDTSNNSTQSNDLAYQSDDDDDSEWVDFIDCLGRTKRCLREDLEEMKNKDAILKATVCRPEEQAWTISEDGAVGENVSDVQPELLSNDMQRELMRQKWEQKEQELMGARDVHYQDLLFDEARQHGVAYYSFSTDEAERLKQQKELKDLRKETEEAQQAAAAAQLLKKKQMKERLRAARRRKRERLGLPPEDSPSEDETEEVPEPPPPPQISDPVQQRKEGPVREWDLGKEDPDRVLSQEEWVSRRRDERPSEFAPPRTFEPTRREEPAKKRGRDNPIKAKRDKKMKGVRLPAGYAEDLKNYPSFDKPESSRVHSDFKYQEDLEEVDLPPPAPRTRAAIPPPAYLDTSRPPPMRKSDIEASVEEGLRFLREQAEKKQNTRSRRDFSPE